MVTPYEPPPDYPMVEGEWQHNKNQGDRRERPEKQRYSSAQIDPRDFSRRLYRYPEEYSHFDPVAQHYQAHMLRTRQFPEVAGIFGCDEQPALRRFTRYNDVASEHVITPQMTSYSKSSKKPSFFSGNWTFRDKKSSRPALQNPSNDVFRRDDRPVSMNLSDIRGTRSRSEISSRQLSVGRSEFRVPVRVERSAAPAVERQEQPKKDFTTHITVEDSVLLRPKKTTHEENNNSVRTSNHQLRKSCPDLETAMNLDEHRVSKKRNRRAREKALEARWKTKAVQEWTLDDVLLWLQYLQLDDVASLLIGYDLRGCDVIKWDHHCLAQLGVSNTSHRVKILSELEGLIERGPEKKEEKRNGRTLFDLVKQTSYDQVLAVETPLTTRDVTVSNGRYGCLQITKVNGSNLPLREHDCLLEINEIAGEQFKSALMLTKLITSSNGNPIRFVVLRQKQRDFSEDSSNDTSSSGISSSPQSPTE